jgi:hypothetical protein
MKIKAYLNSGRYKIINALGIDDIKIIANTYSRWEYIV